MAFDGITIHALVDEFNNKLSGGRLSKIVQTEKDELLCTIKVPSGQYRLLLSCNPTLPLAYITSTNKSAPLQAPMFCMLLRKHLNNGRIMDITQPGLERIINIRIEHLNELGDLCTKYLIVELMGKHSNIIFTDEEFNIIDSIKRVSAAISSVREVLPGRKYFIPNTSGKTDPLNSTRASVANRLKELSVSLSKAIYQSFTGISPFIAEEVCVRAGIDASLPALELSENEITHLSACFCNLIEDVAENNYKCTIFYDNQVPFEFSVIENEMEKGYGCQEFSSVSKMLETYYAQKSNHTRIHQKSADLRQVVTTILERNHKKYSLQENQLKDTEKREKYRLYGELLSAYGYSLPEDSDSVKVLNYYTNEEITIPLDRELTPLENSKRYFDRYAKLKRTNDALTSQIAKTSDEIAHLESVMVALDMATAYEDLLQIREELSEAGYIKKHNQKDNRSRRIKNEPLHYISTDGFHIYVGKNNIQNEELTFHFASGNDWWFHAKEIPGSHVIVKSNGEELPDRTFEEAAALAAYYSKGKNQSKVEVDYVEKKSVKKVNGKAPGFVIYHTNYSMSITPDISGIKEYTE